MKPSKTSRIPLDEKQFADPEIARFYDTHARRFMGPVFRRLTARAAALELPGKRVLDIGTGTGLVAVILAKEHPEWQVTAIDISEDMLVIARETAARNGISDKIDFRIASAEALPFPDNSFDLVVSNTSLHLWAEPLKVFKEIARVTAPGGCCLVWDNVRLSRLNPLPGFISRLMRMSKHQRQLWINAMRSAYTLKEVKALLPKTPLKDAKVENLTGLLMLSIAWKKPES